MKNRPEILNGVTAKLRTGCGSLYLTLNNDEDGNLFEIKINLGKRGSCINSLLYREAILFSIILQLGATKEELRKLIKSHWVGVSCENGQKTEDGRISSCGDIVGRAILEALEPKKSKETKD